MRRALSAIVITLALSVSAYGQSQHADRFVMKGGPCTVSSGNGIPTGGSDCDVYIRRAGASTTTWVNVNGTWLQFIVGTLSVSSLSDGSNVPLLNAASNTFTGPLVAPSFTGALNGIASGNLALQDTWPGSAQSGNAYIDGILQADGGLVAGGASLSGDLHLTGSATWYVNGTTVFTSPHVTDTDGFNGFFYGAGSASLAKVSSTTDASYNMGFGVNALQSLTSGYANLAIGHGALTSTTTGYANTAIGLYAGWGYPGDSPTGVTTGYRNTFIGAYASPTPAVSGLSNAVCIGDDCKVGASNTTVIGNGDTTDVHLFGKLHVGEIASTVFALQTQQLFGGWQVIGYDAGTFAADVADSDTSINFGKSITTSWVLVRASDASGAVGAEYIAVSGTPCSTCTVTRAQGSTTAKAWPVGTAYLVLGSAGTPRIELAAGTTPTLGMMLQGASAAAVTHRVRLGDLNGTFPGYVAPTYGFAAGDPAATWVSADATNGFRVMFGSNAKLAADASGNLTLAGALSVSGSITSGGGNIAMDTGGITATPSSSVPGAPRGAGESSAYKFGAFVGSTGLYAGRNAGASSASILTQVADQKVHLSNTLSTVATDAGGSATGPAVTYQQYIAGGTWTATTTVTDGTNVSTLVQTPTSLAFDKTLAFGGGSAIASSSNVVQTSRTVNGHALSADVSVTKGDVGLGSVENTALSTWAGSSNVTTVGTLSSGSVPWSLVTNTSGITRTCNGTQPLYFTSGILTNCTAAEAMPIASGTATPALADQVVQLQQRNAQLEARLAQLESLVAAMLAAKGGQ